MGNWTTPPAAAEAQPTAGRADAAGTASRSDASIAEVLGFLSRRYSVGPKYLADPAPSADELRDAAALSLRAPDHHELRPFRFVRVSDAGRDRLAALFAADAARRGQSAADIERARERAYNGPALLAVVARVQEDVDDVPAHEQWITVGGAVMNFLNALHLMGYGAKVLSGASVRSPDIASEFCQAGEQLVAWIVAGTPTRASHPRSPDQPGTILTDW
jgi:nitroreductase